MVGFEPTCPVKDKTISSRSRYDHFDTSPYKVCPNIIARFCPEVKDLCGKIRVYAIDIKNDIIYYIKLYNFICIGGNILMDDPGSTMTILLVLILVLVNAFFVMSKTAPLLYSREPTPQILPRSSANDTASIPSVTSPEPRRICSAPGSVSTVSPSGSMQAARIHPASCIRTSFPR